MTIDFMPERQPENRPRITVFGVGGAGGSTGGDGGDGGDGARAVPHTTQPD